MGWLYGLILAAGTVELLSRVALFDYTIPIADAARRALAAMRRNASDHWKQKAILLCAKKMARQSALLGGGLLLFALIIYAILSFSDVIVGGNALSFVGSSVGLIFTTIAAAVYYLTRRQFV